MKGLVLSDDELKILKKRFGPDVREMGPWNSDGTFGCCCISITVVEKAAESIGDPSLLAAVSRLDDAPGRMGRLSPRWTPSADR